MLFLFHISSDSSECSDWVGDNPVQTTSSPIKRSQRKRKRKKFSSSENDGNDEDDNDKDNDSSYNDPKYNEDNKSSDGRERRSKRKRPPPKKKKMSSPKVCIIYMFLLFGFLGHSGGPVIKIVASRSYFNLYKIHNLEV